MQIILDTPQVIALPVQCAESELFPHFLDASTEGGTTPT